MNKILLFLFIYLAMPSGYYNIDPCDAIIVKIKYEGDSVYKKFLGGLALNPFIFIIYDDGEYMYNQELITHEMVHIEQQKREGILFYLKYILSFSSHIIGGAVGDSSEFYDSNFYEKSAVDREGENLRCEAGDYGPLNFIFNKKKEAESEKN